jgi:hypothetical protein
VEIYNNFFTSRMPSVIKKTSATCSLFEKAASLRERRRFGRYEAQFGLWSSFILILQPGCFAGRWLLLDRYLLRARAALAGAVVLEPLNQLA